MKYIMFFTIYSFSIFANENVSLKNVQDLEKKLPSYQWIDVMEEGEAEYKSNRYFPPKEFVRLDTIKNSATRKLIIRKKAPLIRISDDKSFFLTQNSIVEAHIVSDEADYIYLIDEKNNFLYKVPIEFTTPVGDIAKLYEPPKSYKEYKKDHSKIIESAPPTYYPEIIFSTGLTQANFTEDLLEDNRSKTTLYTRYGAAGFIDFKQKIKTGLTVQYERSLHYLKSHYRAQFSSLSIGPILRSKKFNQDHFPWQISTQMRWAPSSKLTTDREPSDKYTMNIMAFQISIEHPVKNDWGEMIWGVGFQRQWINLRRQDSYVRLNSRSTNNDQFGLTLSQSFN